MTDRAPRRTKCFSDYREGRLRTHKVCIYYCDYYWHDSARALPHPSVPRHACLYLLAVSRIGEGIDQLQ